MTLGRYTLVRRVAAGGMAEVYSARSHGISGFEKKVAIKKILPQYSLNKRFVDMLVDEAKITVSLTHSNIAQVYELGRDGDTYYIVMEYVDGRPLNRLMQKLDTNEGRNVPVEHAAHIMGEIAKGLHHAHVQKDTRGRALGIVHRDVTPQNVLLSHTGDVKLIDFGIARAAGRLARTNVGTIKGKLRYLAPEIAIGEEPDHRADVFCCGIVLFEMLTGEAMFAPRTDQEALEMASQARVRSPRDSNPAVPADLEDIVMRALRRDRNTRYQSAEQLYTALRRFLNEHYPAYVGSELGELVRTQFKEEIEEDRRLDEIAEEIIDRTAAENRAATVVAPASELEDPADEAADGPDAATTGQYEEIVTRAGIVRNSSPAPELLPTTPQGAAPEIVRGLPLDDLDDEDEPEDDTLEPTQRAVNPLATEPPSEGTVPDVRAPLHVPSDLDEDDEQVPTRANAPPRRARRIRSVLAAAALLAAVGAGFWFVRSLAPDTNRPAVELPVDAPLATATIVLRVTPSVPVEVLLDGAVVARWASSPVAVGKIDPRRPHTLIVRAAGYADDSRTVSLQPRARQTIDIALEAVTGTIVLSGAQDAKVSADQGTVDGTRIEGVPLGVPITIRVQRPGARVWTQTLTPTTSVQMTVDVPEPVLVPRGTLLVNSRPYSDVYINNRRRGTTPLRIGLAPGRYKIMLKRRDGRTWTTQSKVKSGKTTTVRLKWPK